LIYKNINYKNFKEEIKMSKSNLIVLDRIGADAHYLDAICPAGAYNGDIVVLKDRNVDGTYDVEENTAVTDTGMAIIVHEDLGYRVEDVNMNDITFSAGDIVRVLIPRLGDQISIPVVNIKATVPVAKDAILVPDAGELPLEALADFAGTEVLGWIVEDLHVKAGVQLARIRCIKTER
jgi:hypothetical protein